MLSIQAAVNELVEAEVLNAYRQGFKDAVNLRVAAPPWTVETLKFAEEQAQDFITDWREDLA